MKDILDFDHQLLKHKSIFDIEHDLRLNLHKYFNYELTIVMDVQNPFSLNEDTLIKGSTSKSNAFETTYKELGKQMKEVVAEK
jgi:hypothetical protein